MRAPERCIAVDRSGARQGELEPRVRAGEDAFDALASAMAMARHARSFGALPDKVGPARLERCIWTPPSPEETA